MSHCTSAKVYDLQNAKTGYWKRCCEFPEDILNADVR